MNVSHWLRETVGWAAATGVTASGDPTFAAPSSLRARVIRKAGVAFGGIGTDVVSDTQVMLEQAVTNGDRLWLPGRNTADAEAAQVVQAVESGPDKDGRTLFWVAYL